jgi:hypothetical protein
MSLLRLGHLLKFVARYCGLWLSLLVMAPQTLSFSGVMNGLATGLSSFTTGALDARATLLLASVPTMPTIPTMPTELGPNNFGKHRTVGLGCDRSAKH